MKQGSNVNAAKEVGKNVSVYCKKKGLTSVYLDRRSYPYKGRVRAFAEAVREHGLKF